MSPLIRALTFNRVSIKARARTPTPLCSAMSAYVYRASNGTYCQYDYRPCQSNTCWHNGILASSFKLASFSFSLSIALGICHQTSNTTFMCSCPSGWTGAHCEASINYCQNVTCESKGVCRSSFLNYTCECLTSDFSGRHCEITGRRTRTYQILSTGFAVVAIAAMVTVVVFVLVDGCVEILLWY